MLKKAVLVLGAAVIMTAMAGCDSGTPSPTAGGNAAELPPGIEPGVPPKPGEIEARERPGAEHSKAQSDDEGAP